jgi:hypothetical protein
MGSIAGEIGGFTTFVLFRDFFAAGFSFALAKLFLGLAFAARFTGRFREDLEGLRALPRAIDFALRFRTAGRFFR